jgi:hypothetical protein
MLARIARARRARNFAADVSTAGFEEKPIFIRMIDGKSAVYRVSPLSTGLVSAPLLKRFSIGGLKVKGH